MLYKGSSITFVPFQSNSMKLSFKQSLTSSFDWKFDGKDLEGSQLQSRNLMLLGRYMGSCIS